MEDIYNDFGECPLCGEYLPLVRYEDQRMCFSCREYNKLMALSEDVYDDMFAGFGDEFDPEDPYYRDDED